MITLTADIVFPIKGGASHTGNIPFILGSSVLGGADNVTFSINRKNLIEIGASIFDRGDIKLPNWGIISNAGQLLFNDTDGQILSYAEQNALNEEAVVTIFLNNTLTKMSEMIGKFYTGNWSYDNDNRVVNVSLKDDLEEWQDITIEGVNYDPRNAASKSFEYFYKYLSEKTPNKYNMLSFDELDEKTRSILLNTICKYPTLDDDTLWNSWRKICEVCGLYIYKDKTARTICSYTYGN